MANRLSACTTYGPGIPLSGVTVGQSLNAAANRQAYGILPLANRTLNKIRLFISTVTGSPAAADIQLDLCADGGGFPGTVLVSKTLGVAPVAGTWGEWSGFGQALTAFTQCWAVLKNLNGTPASNFVVPLRGGANLCGLAPGSHTYGFGMKSSTNSGGAWGGQLLPASAPMRVEYADGFDGFPIQTVAAGGVGSGIYGTRKCGSRFTSPNPFPLRCAGVLMAPTVTGAPSANALVQVYEGTTLVAGSVTIPSASANSVNTTYEPFFFATPFTLKPATDYRVVLAEDTNANASTDRYNPTEVTIDSDPNSLALKPWGASLVETYYDGSSWSEANANVWVPFMFILDQIQEFSGGGGGSRGLMTGGRL